MLSKTPLILALILVGSATSVARAEAISDYPSRPIRLVMPNAPGSSNDTMGRIFFAALSNVLGQQIVVDNRTGAGGIVGMEIGKNAPPDGYTLISPSDAAMSIAPNVHKTLPYDPIKDYAFISTFAAAPNVLVVNPKLPAKTIGEFVEYAKAQAGKINMASAGIGSQSHMTGTAFMLSAGFQARHVPYSGGGPSVASVVSGESQWTLTPAAAVLGFIRSGLLRGLGQTLDHPSAMFGDLPPISQSMPGFDYSGWYGIVAPKGTPQAILDKLRDGLIKVVKDPDVQAKFAAQGAELTTSTSDEFLQLVQHGIAENAAIVKAAGIKVEE